MTRNAEGPRGGVGSRARCVGTGGWRRGLGALGIALAVGMVPAARGGAQGEEPPRLEPAAVELSGRFEAAPSRRVYAAIAEQANLAINFDRHAGDPAISIDLRGLAPLAALDRVAQLAGHFHAPVDRRTVIVAEDTPQNRKIYEPVGIRSFTLRHVDTKDVMTALRTLIDVRRIVATEEPAGVTIRDTYPKLAVAARTIAMLDRKPWEIRLRVELLPAPVALLREIEEAGGEISGERAQALRREPGSPLASGMVGLVGTRQARWNVDAAGDRSVGLAARGRLAPDDDRVGLELELVTSSPGDSGTKDMHLVSSFRIEPGHTLAIALPHSGAGPDAPAEAAVLLLTPDVVARGDLGGEPYETFRVGTEGNIAVADP